METLQVLNSTCSLVIFNGPSKRKIKRKQQEVQRRKNQKQVHQDTTSITTSYPKSTPTPLLIPQTIYTQTKLQALDSVVKDLETSISRGIQVEIEIFSSLLETCYRMESIEHAFRIHRLIPPVILRKSTGLSSKLLRLYASFGLVEQAQQLFDEMPKRRDTSAFAWNSLISGYTEVGQYEDAMALYFQMEEDGIEPDQFTFPRVLKACAGLGSIQIGEAIHLHIVRCGFGMNAFVLNALVDMYAKCGDIVKARKVFDKIACRDSVSWNSMLTSYIRHGLLVEALDMFRLMLRDGFIPDSIAVSTIVSRLSSSKLAAEIHGWVIRHGLDQSLSIVNSLIAVYSQQGKLKIARWLFEMMPERDIVSWNSIISGHSKDRRGLEYFEQMENTKVLPDSVTFVALLSVCAHLSLIEDGKRLFMKMKEKYRVRPGMEHFACMVNLLGKAGLIDEAYEIITKQIEVEAGPTVWGALLYACSLHGNVEKGEVAAQRLFELEPDNPHNFELLIKIYGIAGKWDEVEKVMQSMVDRGLDS